MEQRHGDKVQDFDMLDVGSQSNKEIPTENTVLGFRRLYPRSVLICILCCSTYLERITNKECWMFIPFRVFLFRLISLSVLGVLAYDTMEATGWFHCNNHKTRMDRKRNPQFVYER